MSDKELSRLIEQMDPEEAVEQLTDALKGLFPVLDEKTKTRLAMNLFGSVENDHVSSMVHL